MFSTTAGASAAVGTVGSFSFLGWSSDVRIEQGSAGCHMRMLSADALTNNAGGGYEHDLRHELLHRRLPDADVFDHCRRKCCGGDCGDLFFPGLEL